MDPEKNGSGVGDEGNQGGDTTVANIAGPTPSTPLRQNEPVRAYGFVQRSTRVRMAANQVHRGGAAGIYALMCGTICCSVLLGIIFLILINIVSFSSIIIGSIHLHDCPVEPNIPVMLIALGVIAFLIGILDTLDRAKEQRTVSEAGVTVEIEEVKAPSCFVCLNSIFKFAQLILFIYTCIIVYRINSTVEFEKGNINGLDMDHYCHPLVYLFAFWFLTITLIVLGAVLAFLLCVCMCAGALLVAQSD